jgi:hypothetical protein
MNREECIAAIRSGAGKFSLSETLVVFPRRVEAHGVFPQRIPADDGFITSSSERFRISVLVGHDADIPHPRSENFVGREDFGFAKGIIDLSLFFRIPAVQPPVERQQFDRYSILHFEFDRIEFASEVDTTKQAAAIYATGLLLDYKLIAPDKRTVVVEQNAFFGERPSWRLDTAEGELLPNWRFALIQRDKDLEFHLEKTGTDGSTFDDEQRVVDAFLRSVAFIHGQHAWPFCFRHMRDGEYATDWVRPPKPSIPSPHQPFNERIWFNARVGKIAWSFQDALRRAFEFFFRESVVAEEIAELLHQTRDATSGPVHKKVHNIAVCALLDSAVAAIYEHRVKPVHQPPAKAFDLARREVLDFIDGQRTASNDKARLEALERFKKRISDTSYWSTREKFSAVVKTLGLTWERDWQDLYDFWAKWRHRLVHRGARGVESKDPGDDFKVESRVAGAIYLLVLRLMGYEGIAIRSVFEDAFTKIGQTKS